MPSAAPNRKPRGQLYILAAIVVYAKCTPPTVEQMREAEAKARAATQVMAAT